MKTLKQQLIAYQQNQDPNVEFLESIVVREKQDSLKKKKKKKKKHPYLIKEIQ